MFGRPLCPKHIEERISNKTNKTQMKLEFDDNIRILCDYFLPHHAFTEKEFIKHIKSINKNDIYLVVDIDLDSKKYLYRIVKILPFDAIQILKTSNNDFDSVFNCAMSGKIESINYTRDDNNR